MFKLLLKGFLLSLSCITNAATVEPTEFTGSSIQLSDPKQKITPTKFQSVYNQYAPSVQISERPAKPIQPQKTIKQTQNIDFFNTLTTQQSSPPLNQNHPKPELAEFVKKIKSKYEDSELVQQSLSTFYETKQAWNNLDSQVNIFADGMILSLKLDKLIEQDLSKAQPSMQSPSISFFIKKNVNFTQQNQDEKKISFNQILKAQTNRRSQNLNTLNNNFLSKLFSISTVYYAIALIVLFSITQWAIKFALRLFP